MVTDNRISTGRARPSIARRARCVAAALLLLCGAAQVERLTAADAIDVPNGTPTELLAFIEQVQKSPPAQSDFAGVTAHLINVEKAVVAATDKIFAASPSDAERLAGVERKLGALFMLRQLDKTDPAVTTNFQNYIAEASRDANPQVAAIGRTYALGDRLFALDLGNHAEVERLTADVRAHLQTAPLDQRHLEMAYRIGLSAERAGLDKLAAETYRELAALFAKSDKSDVVADAARLAGAARLLELPGHPLPLEGKLLNRSPLDAKSLAGKTVLVLFFASDSGVFAAETANLKDLYAKYRDRGFEIVAVSVDDDRRRLEDFIKREQIEWPVLFEDDPQPLGFDHPLSVHYGVMRLPLGIFIGKDGRVVSTKAEGEELFALLRDAIGPPVVKEKTDDAAPADPKQPVP